MSRRNCCEIHNQFQGFEHCVADHHRHSDQEGPRKEGEQDCDYQTPVGESNRSHAESVTGVAQETAGIKGGLAQGPAGAKRRGMPAAYGYLRAWPLPLKRCPLKNTWVGLRPDRPPRGLRCVFHLRKIGANPRRVLQPVHAAACVYRWKLSVLRRELVSGYELVSARGGHSGRTDPAISQTSVACRPAAGTGCPCPWPALHPART